MNAPAQIKYTGTIGKNKIVLRLNYPIVQATEPAYFHTHTEVVGSYGYNRYKKTIPLHGLWDKGGTLFLVEENKTGPILLTFHHFNPNKKHLNGLWKGRKTLSIVLQQTANIIPKKVPPLHYIGWLHGASVSLNLEQPLPKVKRIEGQNIAMHPAINKTKGIFSFTKNKQKATITGTWSEKGLMLKGKSHDDEILFYLYFEPFDSIASKLNAQWIGDPETQTITFFKTLNANVETIQNQSTALHDFKIIRYEKKDVVRNAITIFSKATGQIIQRIENLDCHESSATRSDTFEIGDYNFDGLQDVKFFCNLHLNGQTVKLLLYDPKHNQYHLTKSIEADAVFDPEQKVFTEVTFSKETKIVRTYRWDDYVFLLMHEKIYKKENGKWEKNSIN